MIFKLQNDFIKTFNKCLIFIENKKKTLKKVNNSGSDLENSTIKITLFIMET